MQFDILTLFPEMFSNVLDASILKRAQKEELIDFNLHNIRNYCRDKHNQADDYPYGGGVGMVLKPEPIFRAVDSLEVEDKTPVIFLTPQGETFNQSLAKDLVQKDRLVFLCGHYEGIDQRVRNEIVTHEVSIGDYVLTGGELPAMVMMDAISRLVPGVVGSSESVVQDSFYQGLLDYPQYTRPQEYQGLEVPNVLLSGNHAKIDRWRRKKSLEQTLIRRPDLLEEKELSKTDKELLAEIKVELGKEG
ncbi:tRNA (guanosine(37)-N1)-methyltransferase TrmD [Halanaerocella petrolearia]